jgi:heme exporter protein A
VPAIEAHNLEFSFGAIKVLRGLSLAAERGSILTIIGPNGAGKTTLLKVLAGLLRPQAGHIRMEGVEPGQDPAAFRRLLGVISHQPYVYPQLTGRENLEFYARLYGLNDPRAAARRTLEEMGLAPVMDRQVSGYSRGMLQRLAVGRALLHRPRILLLDEPFTGLDHGARAHLSTLLGALRDGDRTILMTTHDLQGMLEGADRVAVLVGGRVVLDLPASGLEPNSLLARYEALAEEGFASANTER